MEEANGELHTMNRGKGCYNLRQSERWEPVVSLRRVHVASWQRPGARGLQHARNMLNRCDGGDESRVTVHGKQFFKALMRRKPNGGGWSQPEPADWLHGCSSERRRESAVLIRQVTTWRLERLGLKSLTAFHDLTNAFGSVKWEAKDRSVASLLGPNALIEQQKSGWQLQRFQAETATSHSKFVRAG